jgi:HEAT repeats
MNPLRCLCMLGLAGIVAGPTRASVAEAPAAPVPTPQATVGTDSVENRAIIRYSDGLLIVDVEGRPLSEVLDILAEKVPMRIYVRDSVKKETDEQIVSANFEGLTLQSGLKALLGGRSFALSAEAMPAEDKLAVARDGSMMELWLLGGNGGYSEFLSVPDPRSTESSLTEPDESAVEDLAEAPDEELRDMAVEAPDSGTRYKAMIYLGDRAPSSDNAEAFIAGLSDEDPQVRWMALGQIFSMAEDVPLDVLREVIVSDPDPTIRRQALAVLVHKKAGDARDVLQEVRAGRDPEMRAYAEQLLRRR